jgi:hypothetical protein
MPKGEIVGMFTGRVCFSLMERTTTRMENRKETMIASGIVFSKLRRNNVEVHGELKCASGLRLTSFSLKDQRSRPLTLRNYSKSGGSVSPGGGEQWSSKHAL